MLAFLLLLVQLDSAKAHVVPELGILRADAKRQLLEALERLIVLLALEQAEGIVEEYLLRLERCLVVHVLVRVQLRRLRDLRVAHLLVVRFLSELERLGQVVGRHGVLSESQMQQAQAGAAPSGDNADAAGGDDPKSV